MLLPGLDLQYIARFPGSLGVFQHLSAKYGWRPKKSYHLSAEPLALRHMTNLALVIALRSIKG